MESETIICAPSRSPWRTVPVEVDGKTIHFNLDKNDHWWLPPGTTVTVRFHPEDQFARIISHG